MMFEYFKKVFTNFLGESTYKIYRFVCSLSRYSNLQMVKKCNLYKHSNLLLFLLKTVKVRDLNFGKHRHLLEGYFVVISTFSVLFIHLPRNWWSQFLFSSGLFPFILARAAQCL